MPTEKQRINVTVDDELYGRIKAYCAEKGCSASKAMIDLVQLGLGHYSGSDTLGMYDNVGRLDIKLEHIHMAKAISELPPYSRKVVRTVLKLEENRPRDEVQHLQIDEEGRTAVETVEQREDPVEALPSKEDAAQNAASMPENATKSKETVGNR